MMLRRAQIPVRLPPAPRAESFLGSPVMLSVCQMTSARASDRHHQMVGATYTKRSASGSEPVSAGTNPLHCSTRTEALFAALVCASTSVTTGCVAANRKGEPKGRNETANRKERNETALTLRGMGKTLPGNGMVT